MKAHRVKCQQCANGVTVVVAHPKDSEDGEGQLMEVFAGIMSEVDAVVAMSEIVAQEETEAAGSILEEGEESDEYTAEDIRLDWVFHVSTLNIRSDWPNKE